jgi:hypothetical protein
MKFFLTAIAAALVASTAADDAAFHFNEFVKLPGHTVLNDHFSPLPHEYVVSIDCSASVDPALLHVAVYHIIANTCLYDSPL